MQWPGYMEGAIEAGERAAAEVLSDPSGAQNDQVCSLARMPRVIDAPSIRSYRLASTP